jgi:hypothetical protein
MRVIQWYATRGGTSLTGGHLQMPSKHMKGAEQGKYLIFHEGGGECDSIGVLLVFFDRVLEDTCAEI